MANRIGQQLGNYRLVRPLGQGGFAEVYLSEHIHLGTEAAIKLLHTQVVGEAIETFREEARTIARLIHPHIVRVFDFGIEGETPFLVMDYAPNGTVRKRHPRGIPLPLPTILSYVRQVADALQYAHDEHYIHRDIKPENLLIGRRQEILLSDFGIALIAQTSRSQSMQDVAGTASYMAPEQFQGRPRPASDQYAFAVMVYEWLTGTCPFHGSFTEVASQHLFMPPPPLESRMSSVSPKVEQVVMTALAKDPHQRFNSVQAFATAFDQAGQSAISRTLSAGQPIDAMNNRFPSMPSAETTSPPDRSSLSQQPILPSQIPPTILAWPVNESVTVVSSEQESSPLPNTGAPQQIGERTEAQKELPPTILAAPSNPPHTVKELTAPVAPRRGTKWKNTLLVGLVLLVVVIGLGIFSLVHNGQTAGDQANTTTEQIVDPNYVPVDGIYCDALEQSVEHIHAHLTIYINGQNVPLVANTGIAPIGVTSQANVTCFYWLHTHDASGVIHIESPTTRPFTLNQFLDIWEKFSSSSSAFPTQLLSSAGWTIYVNGKQVNTDFSHLQMHAHDLITLAYNSPGVKPDTSYAWQGL